MKDVDGRVYRSQEEWRHHLQAWHKSGMRMTAYAKAHGLNVKSFGNAQRRLSGTGGKSRSVSRPVFKRVVVTPSQSNCSVYRASFPDGMVVECDGSGDLVRFSELLEKLRLPK
jgi:hypothetical protein